MTVTLRDVREEDLETFFRQQADPEAHRMAVIEPRDREAFFRHWREKIFGNPDALKQAIEVDGQLVGDIGSWLADGQRHVGYMIGREFWGRGIATDALAEFVRSHATSRPLHATVATTNPASARVLEKCGFVRLDRQIADDGVEEFLYELTK